MYSWQAGGTHPTGMLSCFILISLLESKERIHFISFKLNSEILTSKSIHKIDVKSSVNRCHSQILGGKVERIVLYCLTLAFLLIT